MNGADALCDTLLAAGVDTCFANPGTSEMHFVAALDRKPQMRCVLGLSEGVVTGAADGYARMADKPAATLLHLGPGLANGLANLHNARRANSPIVNVVGDHATYHLQYDAPLTTDIEMLARPMSHWVRTVPDADHVSAYAADAVAQARTAPGRIATLILPADAAWNVTEAALEPPRPLPPRRQVSADRMRDAVQAVECLILIGAVEPVAFFAYPGKPSRIAPPDCAVLELAAPGDDLEQALDWLASELSVPAATAIALPALARPPLPTGALTPVTVATAL